MLRRVFGIYVEQAPVLMPAAAVLFVLSGIVAALLVEAGPGTALLGDLIALVALAAFTAIVVELVAGVRDGRAATARQLLRATSPVIFQVLVVGIAVGVGVLVGLFLLLVPGLILITVWSVALPVVVLERPVGLRALRRSRELVSGNGPRVFVVIVLLGALVLAAAGVSLAAGSARSAAGIVVGAVVGVLTAPIASLAQAVLYFELRDLKGAARAPSGGPEVSPAEPQPPAPDPQPPAAEPQPPAPEPQASEPPVG